MLLVITRASATVLSQINPCFDTPKTLNSSVDRRLLLARRDLRPECDSRKPNTWYFSLHFRFILTLSDLSVNPLRKSFVETTPPGKVLHGSCISFSRTRPGDHRLASRLAIFGTLANVPLLEQPRVAHPSDDACSGSDWNGRHRVNATALWLCGAVSAGIIAMIHQSHDHIKLDMHNARCGLNLNRSTCEESQSNIRCRACRRRFDQLIRWGVERWRKRRRDHCFKLRRKRERQDLFSCPVPANRCSQA